MGRQWLQAKREVANLKKGQAVGKLAKEIAVAAKLGGADPDSNARLAAAVEKARKASVTRDAIERAIKKGAGTGDEKMTMEVRGRHISEGIPKSVTISDAEVRDALRGIIDILVHAVRDVLERIPPELSADIYDRGVMITGGGALLRNLDKRLREDTQLPVTVAEEPLTSVVMGAGRMLSDLPLLKRLAAA